MLPRCWSLSKCRPRARLLKAATRLHHTDSALRPTITTPGHTRDGRTDYKRVAVIGGGITGLWTAFKAQGPDTHVTLYEKSQNLGGWIQSETIEVDGGQIVFDYGPQMMRMDGKHDALLHEMLRELNFKDHEILKTTAASPASFKRYIYYPDHLVQLPAHDPNQGFHSNIINNVRYMFSDPLLSGIPLAMIREPLMMLRGKDVADESIGQFISRRFGKTIADNIASAMFHGIYAGDIYRLSAQANLGWVWDTERDSGSLMMGVAERMGKKGDSQKSEKPKRDIFTPRRMQEMANPKQFESEVEPSSPKVVSLSVVGGLGSITQRLGEHLSASPLTEVIKNADVSHLRKETGSNRIEVELSDKSVANYDYVISTTPTRALANQLRGPEKDESTITRLLDKHDYAVNVMVVNLFYYEPDLLPVHGFGYLIPRSVPLSQNPERALGVIFKSDTVTNLDTVTGTKLTVMLGGHWWDDWGQDNLPDDQSGIEMAKSLVARHLGIQKKPAVARARLLRECIPQYTVGHSERMTNLHEELTRKYYDRLKVAGAWYTEAGINACLSAGSSIAASVHARDATLKTGLERYLKSEERNAKH